MIVRVTSWILFAVMVALSASACGGDADVDGIPGQLLLVRDDLVVTEMIWQDAPAGCEGRLLDSDVEVAWAEGAPSLAVVIDLEGLALCVDTWESIEIEVQKVAMGDPSPDPGLVALPTIN